MRQTAALVSRKLPKREQSNYPPPTRIRTNPQAVTKPQRIVQSPTHDRKEGGESLEVARYRSQLIYEATVDEDREKIWDNRAAWNKLNVLNGIDLVEVVLKAGEKDAILEKLDEISGYQPNVEEVVKN